jgi:hypothetical protein
MDICLGNGLGAGHALETRPFGVNFGCDPAFK